MKAKFIFEKFSEESDPIKDLGIGGVNPSIKWEELRKKFIEEWSNYLRQYSFIGKRISGKMHKERSINDLTQCTTGKIKDIKIDSSLESQGIRFVDENNISYFYMIKDGGKLFIY